MRRWAVELLETDPPTVLACDDIALVLSTWAMTVPGPDGEQVRVSGTAPDVLRRFGDGSWRYVIDDPVGIELATA